MAGSKARGVVHVSPDFYEDDPARAIAYAQEGLVKELVALGCDPATVVFEEPVLTDIGPYEDEEGQPIPGRSKWRQVLHNWFGRREEEPEEEGTNWVWAFRARAWKAQ